MSLTPDENLDLIFPASHIPVSVHDRVPQELHLRPLASDDYERGHLDVLAVLASAPDVGAVAWKSRFEEMKTTVPDSYYPIAIVDRATDRIVAIGTLFVEIKFLRGNARAGHIEDIAVDVSQQGKGLGKTIIAALTAISEEKLGCYKVFLDCSEQNKPFYEKCGYKYAGVQMVSSDAWGEPERSENRASLPLPASQINAHPNLIHLLLPPNRPSMHRT